MPLPNIFSESVTNTLIQRINKLSATTQPKWGKMDVGQMLAHCNVTYEMVYDNKHPQPNSIGKFFLKLFIKDVVVSEKPYKKNSQTAPAFKMTTQKVFEEEKASLISYIHKTQQLGGSAFDNKASLSFGPLTTTEWNNMFYKHLDHHLSQFGV